MYLTTKGLVIRVCPYNESDSMLTILTSEQGRISAKVRGLRKKNSPLSAPCQLLSYAEFTLFEYKGSYTVNEGQLLELFSGLRKDLQLLSLGTYFAQAAEVVAQEDIPNPELLSLTLNCLHALSKMSMAECKVKAVFELRISCIAGYTPDLYGCYICGDLHPDFFDVTEGRLICSHCRNSASSGIRMPITSGVLDAMRYICVCDSKKIFSFDLPTEGMEQLSSVTEAYFSTQIERGFSTLDFYKSLIYYPSIGV